ncbi:MAG TPA: winged helix DNA-binding domain-containing protein [Baekduia sp.]|nr:winged helix DNA-binding domain-containing protein [Baekduia sp.]HET6510406.1 winged helix DNA-binding domain-containing protein [Baekduia sp.]
MKFSAVERRARLGARHRLAGDARAGSVEEIAASVVAIHSTDPASVVIASWARLADRACGPEEVERALYDERTLIRMLAMRRTMFVVDRATAPVIHAAASLGVAARERAKLLKGLDRSPAWLRETEAIALEALSGAELTATELAAADERLAESVRTGSGKWSQEVKLASRLLLVLAAEGRAIRARPRGSWSSTQFRWTALESWLGAPLEELDPHAAERALARAWLRAYGPAREDDLRWWAGWTKTQTRRALAGDDVVACLLEDDAPGVVAADDVEPIADGAAPWIAFLPALDATPMGWKHRDWYLGDHAERVFDVNGNVAPTVWSDGRIVGAWTRDGGGADITYTLFEDLGAEAVDLLDAEAAALTPRLGDATLAPRARGYAPAERALLDRA